MLGGFNDGNLLYLVLKSHREHSNKFDCEKYPNSCRDIYYIVSEDGGDTWDKPIPVPRKDMNDRKNRYSLETGSDYNVSYVMKSPGSFTFAMGTQLAIDA